MHVQIPCHDCSDVDLLPYDSFPLILNLEMCPDSPCIVLQLIVVHSIGNDFVSPVLVEDEVLDSSGLVSAEDLVLSSLVDMGHAPKRRCTTASPSAAAVDDLPPPPIPLHATPLAATASGNQHRNMSNVASMSPKQSSSSPMQTRSPVTGAVRSFLLGSPNTATGSGYVTPAMLYPGTQVTHLHLHTCFTVLMTSSGTALAESDRGGAPHGCFWHAPSGSRSRE